MQRTAFLPLLLLSALATACQPDLPAKPACPTPAADIPSTAAASGKVPIATSVEIDHRMIAVDQVIEGSLCDGTWRGTVYVTCNIRVRPWTENPDFLRGCPLAIEPGTTVYVAAHNNAAYYNGCSCHTGELP